MSSHTTRPHLPESKHEMAMLCYNDISLLGCGTETMPVNPYTINYLHWHAADNSSRESMLLCCIRVVVWVERAFYEHGIQFESCSSYCHRLVWLEQASSVSACAPGFNLTLCFLVKLLVLLGKYLSKREWHLTLKCLMTKQQKRHPHTRGVSSDGWVRTQRSAETS